MNHSTLKGIIMLLVFIIYIILMALVSKFGVDNGDVKANDKKIMKSEPVSKQIYDLSVEATPDDMYNISPIPPQVDEFIQMGLPKVHSTSFKSYMSYKCITNRTSRQYKLQRLAYSDGGFRKIDGMYMVAIGTYYAQRCGEIFRVTLDSGKQFMIIVGDIKMNAHTDKNHQYTPMRNGGNILEFIVDYSCMDKKSKTMGDMSYSSLEGNIANIEKLMSENKFVVME